MRHCETHMSHFPEEPATIFHYGKQCPSCFASRHSNRLAEVQTTSNLSICICALREAPLHKEFRGNLGFPPDRKFLQETCSLLCCDQRCSIRGVGFESNCIVARAIHYGLLFEIQKHPDGLTTFVCRLTVCSLIESRLLYGLPSGCLYVSDVRRLDGFQCRCLRQS